MKEKILDKATELFLDLGFKSVTMDDLAHEMGISKKTIYSYFKNKTKLVEETTSKLVCTISTGIGQIRELHKNPIEELYEIKKFVMLNLKNEKSSPQHQLQKYYPKIYDKMHSGQFELMEECIEENLQRGIDQGIYRENIQIDFISRIYFSGVTSIKNQKLFPMHKFPVATLMAEYLEYHLRGIVTPKGRKILNTIINSNYQ
ncbi:transcriptional regulator, TetR family [Pricia antarctica]|uniref:Transcriptional regulator, TetR family n=1 Tax=Pricia antarctica TaxID=641691 RepID=A0A1G6Y054_9FLAO|nr:TetR/AcrR family transcriptional regulator [Pricia antarctica]SDD83844.1 transcriptional regulator, TetR family [Pricia antarctica]